MYLLRARTGLETPDCRIAAESIGDGSSEHLTEGILDRRFANAPALRRGSTRIVQADAAVCTVCADDTFDTEIVRITAAFAAVFIVATLHAGIRRTDTRATRTLALCTVGRFAALDARVFETHPVCALSVLTTLDIYAGTFLAQLQIVACIIVLTEEFTRAVSAHVRRRAVVVDGTSCRRRVDIAGSMGTREHKVTNLLASAEITEVAVDKEEVRLALYDIELQSRAGAAFKRFGTEDLVRQSSQSPSEAAAIIVAESICSGTEAVHANTTITGGIVFTWHRIEALVQGQQGVVIAGASAGEENRVVIRVNDAHANGTIAVRVEGIHDFGRPTATTAIGRLVIHVNGRVPTSDLADLIGEWFITAISTSEIKALVAGATLALCASCVIATLNACTALAYATFAVLIGDTVAAAAFDAEVPLATVGILITAYACRVSAQAGTAITGILAAVGGNAASDTLIVFADIAILEEAIIVFHTVNSCTVAIDTAFAETTTIGVHLADGGTGIVDALRAFGTVVIDTALGTAVPDASIASEVI